MVICVFGTKPGLHPHSYAPVIGQPPAEVSGPAVHQMTLGLEKAGQPRVPRSIQLLLDPAAWPDSLPQAMTDRSKPLCRGTRTIAFVLPPHPRSTR